MCEAFDICMHVICVCVCVCVCSFGYVRAHLDDLQRAQNTNKIPELLS
jgi:hypothetical protein